MYDMHIDDDGNRVWENRFKGRYRVDSTRKLSHDYKKGWYFITVCTKHRRHWLSIIQDGKIVLKPAGKIVEEEWLRTQALRPTLKLDAFVIMPDHFHALLHLNGKDPLGNIIGLFKGTSTKRIRSSVNPQFAWQPRFYDRICQSAKARHAVRRYIINNPMNWHH